MEQTGYVTEINGDRVKVRADRESACGGNCVSCKGCPTSAIIIECKTDLDLEIGDTVTLIMPNGVFYKNAFVGYGIMTILTISGAFAGFALFESEGASVLGALAGIFTGLFLTKLLSAKDSPEIIIKRKG